LTPEVNSKYKWFSPDTPASSTTKTGRHDITEILLKVALKHQISKQNQSKHKIYSVSFNATLSLAAVSRVPPFCNLQNWARTYAVLVIGLYELLTH
jgi:hypothetical protein